MITGFSGEYVSQHTLWVIHATGGRMNLVISLYQLPIFQCHA